MNNPFTRRAALARALAAVPALAGAAATAMPSLTFRRADAELFALQPEIEAADAQLKASHAPFDQAEAAYHAALEPVRGQREYVLSPEEAEKVRQIMEAIEANPRVIAAQRREEEREEERQRLKDETGFTAADNAQNAAFDAINEVRDNLVAMQATTLAGLVFKARYAAAHFPGDPDSDVVESILDDLIALGDEEAANV